jgi:Galactose oxidase, central domain
MPALNPPSCSNSIMSLIPGIGPVLLNNGNYPSYAMYTNITYKWNGTNWSTSSPAQAFVDPAGPLPGRIGGCSSELFSNNTMVLFGGQSDIVPLNDTWVFNGTTWTKSSPATAPSTRSYAAMSCGFSSLSKVLMFGGKNEVNLHGDTWLWDGSNWTRQILSVKPSARYGAKLAGGISATRNSILFGGASNTNLFNDTWQWTDTTSTWSQISVATSPSGRIYHSMTKDSANSNVIVLFGGTDNVNILSDTWVFDGTAWTKKNPVNSPSARYGAQMCYDANVGAVILFGGTNGTSDLNDTWKFTGTNWVQL